MTTIIFPILTFAIIFILGITIGFYISTKIENKIETSKTFKNI